jgi:radial spoke head protein 4A
VTTDLLSGKWTRLPDLKPSQIRAARQIKVKFTGDLQRKVFTNPFFFGLEIHYLRAQIARIAHSTAIMPRRLWKLSEDNDRDIEEATTEEGDPIPYPSVLQLANAGEWGHQNPSILQQACRIVHVEPTAPENDDGDFDPEVALQQVQQSDPFEPRLKPITDDRPIYGKTPAWIVRLSGDKAEYTDPNMISKP